MREVNKNRCEPAPRVPEGPTPSKAPTHIRLAAELSVSPRISLIQPKCNPLSPFICPFRKVALQTGGDVCLRSNQIMQSWLLAGNDAEDRLRYQLWSRRLLFLISNGGESALAPGLVFLE